MCGTRNGRGPHPVTECGPQSVRIREQVLGNGDELAVHPAADVLRIRTVLDVVRGVGEPLPREPVRVERDTGLLVGRLLFGNGLGPLLVGTGPFLASRDEENAGRLVQVLAAPAGTGRDFD